MPQTLGGCRLQLFEQGLGVFREVRRGSMPTIALAPGARALWDNRFSVALAREAPGPVTVEALGEGLSKERRAAFSWLAGLPPQARIGLPGCWREGKLISVPRLPPLDNRHDAHGFSASFLHAE